MVYTYEEYLYMQTIHMETLAGFNATVFYSHERFSAQFYCRSIFRGAGLKV